MACRGFDEIVRRSVNPAEHQSILAELHEAKRVLDDPANVGKQVVLGMTSKGTQRGDPDHYDADVAAMNADGSMAEAVQVLRATTLEMRKALATGMEKGVTQLNAAPAARKRVVIYLQQGTPAELAQHHTMLAEYTVDTGIAVEVVFPSGERISATGSKNRNEP